MPRDPEPIRALLNIPALVSIRARLDQQARLLIAVREGLPALLSGYPEGRIACIASLGITVCWFMLIPLPSVPS